MRQTKKQPKDERQIVKLAIDAINRSSGKIATKTQSII